MATFKVMDKDTTQSSHLQTRQLIYSENQLVSRGWHFYNVFITNFELKRDSL